MRSIFLRACMLGACFFGLSNVAGCGGGGGNVAGFSSAAAASGTGAGASSDASAGTSASAAGSSAAAQASDSATGSGSGSGTSASTTTSGTSSGGATSATSGSSGSSSVAAPTALSLSVTPKSNRVGLNGLFSLSVVATSSTPLSYQWRRNGQALSGETAVTFQRVLSAADLGASFDVLVSNSSGSTISSAIQPELQLAPRPVDPAPVCHNAQALATTGTPVAALADLDAQIQAYLIARQTPSATMVVRYNGVVVLERGYGWLDFTCTRPTPYDSIFRTASLAKPLTAAAVRKAASEGRFQLTDRAFCLPGSPTNCILDMRTVTAADPRMADITVQHLLDHTGGWHRDVLPDPGFRNIEIATELGVNSPPVKFDLARHTVMTFALTNPPGAVTSYLNFGYQVLGLILEAKTGKTYVQQVQDSVLSPLGIPATDARGARSLPTMRFDREPWYSDPRADVQMSVFDPGGPGVKFPDGGTSMENIDASGGWLVSGRAYSRFMRAYWLDGTQRGSSGQWLYFGSLPGTFTMALERDLIDVVILTNQRQLDIGGPSDEALSTIVDDALSRVTAWPTTPPAGHLP